MLVEKLTKNIWVIPNFWGNDVCNALIEETESSGFFPKTLDDLSVDREEFNINNKSRIRFVSEELGEAISNNLAECAPRLENGSVFKGINENFRFYKYLPGQEFKKHKDNVYFKNEREKSYFSLLIYLNDTFSGGETIFDNCQISPKTGSAVIFPHELLHSGNLVNSGVKYVLRTDIIYRT